jgi:hypothetical protein
MKNNEIEERAIIEIEEKRALNRNKMLGVHTINDADWKRKTFKSKGVKTENTYYMYANMFPAWKDKFEKIQARAKAKRELEQF